MEDDTNTPLAVTSRRALSAFAARALAQAICKRLMVDATVARFVDLVVERGRASGLAQMATSTETSPTSRPAPRHGDLGDAQPAAAGQIKAALEKNTGKTVLLDQAVDPDIIGGVVTQVGSYRLDRSVKTMLEQMRSGLKQGA